MWYWFKYKSFWEGGQLEHSALTFSLLDVSESDVARFSPSSSPRVLDFDILRSIADGQDSVVEVINCSCAGLSEDS